MLKNNAKKSIEVNSNSDEILVSIICITYNHEKYIKYALDGFLMQKTNFKYEILVNDDASTDNTAKILKEYQKNFPRLLRVIYQKENQHSKGIIVTSILLEQARGKYLAFCEGDDFWIDENKLQKQVDFLEQNKNYSAVSHNTFVVNEFNKEFVGEQNCFPLLGNYIQKRWTLLPDHLIGQLGTIVCINYWSILLHKRGTDFIKVYNKKLPTGAGDTKITFLLNQMGDMYHMQEIMSCYRRTYIGESYNAKVKNKDLSRAYYDSITVLEKMVQDIFQEKKNTKIIKTAHNILIGDYLIRFIKSRKLKDLKIFYNLYSYHNNKISFVINFFIRVFKKVFRVNFVNQNPIDFDYYMNFRKQRHGHEI